MVENEFDWGSNRWQVVKVLDAVCSVPGVSGTFQKLQCKAIASLGRNFNAYANLPLYAVGQEVLLSTYQLEKGKCDRHP